MASNKSAGIGFILQALGRGISTGREVGLRKQEQQRRAILATQREDIRQRERGEDIDFREKAVRRAIEDKINEKQLQAGRENAAELQRQLETEATEEVATAKSERDVAGKKEVARHAIELEQEFRVGRFKPEKETTDISKPTRIEEDINKGKVNALLSGFEVKLGQVGDDTAAVSSLTGSLISDLEVLQKGLDIDSKIIKELKTQHGEDVINALTPEELAAEIQNVKDFRKKK